MFARVIRNGVHRGQWILSASKVLRVTPVISTRIPTMPSIRLVHFSNTVSEQTPTILEELEGNVLPNIPSTPRLETSVSTFEEAIGLLKVVI